MKIGDIVTQAADAEFANDVKLDSYADPAQNLRLACSYKFTYKVPAADGKNLHSSVNVLQSLQRSLENSLENRHTVIATFGHGKSHFALALANFYGKASDSPEVAAILENVGHVAGPGVAQNFADYKAGRPPFLIIRLRGDVGQSLPQQFLQGLENALTEHPGTKGETLPFWFAAAERFLATLSDDQRDRADALLATTEQPTDVVGLLEKVRTRQPEVYDLCIQVHQHLFGTRPDFGGEVSLQRAVSWAVETYCEGSNQKAGGLLVLFDEFSAFIENYALRRVSAGGTRVLQDLLNGISDKKGRALFVGFCQHDPDVTADNTFRYAGSEEQLQSLHLELTRLPQPQRYQLYSSMETVLDGYLAQEKTAWERFKAQVYDRLDTASDNARTLLKPRYEDSAGWGDGKFEDIVTDGCFPLHPLTTGLFCHLEFKNSARRVLQFVLDALERKQDEEAIVNGRPNWVYPISLVDFFDRNFAAEREYEEYERARSATRDLPEVERAVIKGVLLFHVGQLKLGQRLRFDQAMTNLTGHPADQCEAALKTLEEMGVVSFNPTTRTYGFLEGGKGHKLKTWLLERRKRKSLDWQTMSEIRERPGVWTKSHEIENLQLGHLEDWSCPEILLPAPLFTPENLRKLIRPFTAHREVILDGMRGALIRLVASTEAEVATLRERAASVLDEALGTAFPLPVVVAVPLQPRPNLVNALLDFHSLEAEGRTARDEFGPEAVNVTLTTTKTNITNELEMLRGWAEYVVPQPYRAAVAASAQTDNVKSYLRACHWAAYRVPSVNFRRFFTNRKADNAQLRRAVGVVAKLLMEDRLGENGVFDNLDNVTKSIAEDIVRNFLRAPGWNVVDVQDHTCEPQTSYVKAAWKYLDKKFGAGETSVPVKDPLLCLLNPPFGFDYNQVVLLFAAWYGYNRRDLDLHEVKRGSLGFSSMDQFTPHLDRPKIFLEKLCLVAQVCLTRRDPDKETEEVRELLEKVRRENFTPAEARGAITRLTQYAEDARNDQRLRSDAETQARRLQADLDRASEYRTAYQAIRSGLDNNAAKFTELVGLRDKASSLPELGRVREELPTYEAVIRQVDERLESRVGDYCARYERLTDIKSHDNNLNELTKLKKAVERLGKPTLRERVEEAEARLRAAARFLEEEQKDAEVIAVVQRIQTRDVLKNLVQGLTLLDHVSTKTEKAQRLVATKRKELEERILHERQTVCEIEARPDHIVSVAAARNLRDNVLSELANYKGTPEHDTLTAVTKRLEALEQFFTQVEQAERAPLQSPEEVETRLRQIEEIGHKFAPDLSDTQRTRVASAQAAVNEAASKAVATAVEWLEQRGKLIEVTTKPGGLLEELRRPPAFLPPTCVPELEALRDRLRARMDNDEVLLITEHFQRIKDKARRLNCLRALQEIADRDEP